ncbi:MAG: response regulator, partial [Ruminiclostridium sp.]|nr:response regulator [Ruminiclostridium sp.]
ELRDALLLRVVSVSVLEQKWAFPSADYELAEISLFASDGSYIIKSRSVKNSNFFEFYKSYNMDDYIKAGNFEQQLISNSGSLKLLDSRGEECIIAYTPVMSTDNWVLIMYMPMSGFAPVSIDWLLIGVVFAGLLLLLVFDLAVMLVFNSKLAAAARGAENANKAKTYFLSTMSHDIRTPMNSILGMNEMVLRECDDEDIIVYSEHIRASGNTLLGLINDILDFSKIEAGKLDIIPVDYEISSVLNDLVNMVQTRADAKGLTLELNIDENIPRMLHGDEIRLKQVITNILTNAVKYTKQGTVTFSVGYEKAENDPDSITLNVSVKDTGTGIREEDMDRLFSAFERINEADNRNIDGTGLGLSIAQSILGLMGSTLEIKSEYGKGSVFGFSVKQKVIKWEPVGDYEAAFRRSVAERRIYKEKFTAPDAKVLVVDDTPVNITVFKSLLKRTKIQIDTAESGDECIVRASLVKYDVIFLDHMMPVKDGIETLRELKSSKKNRNLETPVICLTANAVSGMRESYLAAGFDDYLTKPIDPESLENVIIGYLPKDKLMPADESTDKDKDAETQIPEYMYNIEGLDVSAGLRHCGTPGAYMATVQAFYETALSNIDEIRGYRNGGDLHSATVKVHALKSSSRVIGAEKLGTLAELLEKAGKENDTETFGSNIDALLDDYRCLADKLAAADKTELHPDELPVIPEEKLKEAYAAILEFSEQLDYDSMNYIIESLSAYSLPSNEKERVGELKKAILGFDCESIPDIIAKGDR